MAIRGIQPKKGSLDVVGGFLNYGEHPEEGAIRETKEETGLYLNNLKFLGIYVDEYQYQNETIKTLNVVYVATIKSGKLKEGDDVSKLVWVDIKRKPVKSFAFEMVNEAFSDLQKLYKI